MFNGLIFLLVFRDNIIASHAALHFLPEYPPIYFSLLFFKFMAYLSLIAVACIHTVYIHIIYIYKLCI